MTTIRHADIWSGIDKLAKSNGLSPSGLARRAGLDPTAFNKSKRINPQGKPRWPTTESLAKALVATRSTLADYVRLVGSAAGAGGGRVYPVTGLASLRKPGAFGARGEPVGRGWKEVDAPDIGDSGAYAIKVTGEGLAPVFRAGDLILLSPEASVRKGDRVLVSIGGRTSLREVVRRNRREVEFRAIGAGRGRSTVAAKDIDWMHRVAWVAQ